MTSRMPPEVSDMDHLLAISEAGSRGAATALSQILGRPVDLEIPQARRVPLDQVAEIAGGAARPVCALSLKVRGGLQGDFLLLFAQEEVPRLLALLPHGGFRDDGTVPAVIDRDSLEESALREIGNILAAAYLNAVSHLIGSTLLPSTPAMALDMAGAVTDFVLIDSAARGVDALVLVGEVREPHSGVRGSIVFVPDPASLAAPADRNAPTS
jgi:chemotaxis protein CheC